jgi:hypothetical protein
MHFIKKILKTISLIINDTLRLTEWIFLFSAFVGVPVVLFGIVAMIWLLITIIFFFVEIIVIAPFFLLLNIWVRFISFIIGDEALLLPAIPRLGK